MGNPDRHQCVLRRIGEALIPRADFLRHLNLVYALLHIVLISKSSFSDYGTKPALYWNTDTMFVLKL